MGELAEAAALGLVQGLTEFLPVSSSGHLALFQHMFDWDDPKGNLTFNIAVHLGSLAAVLIFVRRELIAMFTKEPRLLLVCAIATVPVAVAGLALKDAVGELATNLFAVGGFLLCTAAILALAMRLKDGTGRAVDLTPGRAFLVGLAQALAIFPGISRSGSTLVGGLAVGLERGEAVRFSFLLAVPAISRAGLVMVLGADSGVSVDWTPMLVGAAVAFVSSLFAMRLLVAAVIRRKLGWFAAYCAVVGLSAIVAAV